MASLLQSRLLHISVAVLSGVAAAFFLVSIPRPFTTGPLRSLPLSSQKHDRKAMGGSEEPSCVCDADAPVDRRASAGEFAGFKAILEDSSRNASEVRVRNKKGVVISVETPSSKGETQGPIYIYLFIQLYMALPQARCWSLSAMACTFTFTFHTHILTPVLSPGSFFWEGCTATGHFFFFFADIFT